MDPFSAVSPEWVDQATHTTSFACPHCGEGSRQAKAVWINRRSPVYSEGQRRRWQEFYHCGNCGIAWWAWSSDRPPTVLSNLDSPVDGDA
ncbi:MAG: hypothetical protein ACKO21_01145 [Nodosilinea sp.]|jgi:predicted RNA-binding Zn-ribbon protein involved in translation (DUF1610 family)